VDHVQIRLATLTSALALASLALALPGAASALTAVDAGALKARVGTDPWRLELTDRGGHTVLAQHPGTGTGATGALGFRSLLGWQRATRVISSSRVGKAYHALLATTDPLRRIDVTLKPAGNGVIALEASLVGPALDVVAMGLGFEAAQDERYLGFGERSNRVDQAGGTVENYVADGPYQPLEYTPIAAFVPPWGLRDGREDATYFPIPWLLSSSGYGVLVDNPETSSFRLGSDQQDAWSVEVAKAPPGELGAEQAPPVTELRLRFFAGPKPADALRRFSAAVGRQPRAGAPWVYGPWFQPGDLEADMATLRKADAPVSVMQTYTHYLPCGDQQPDRERERTRAAHRGGVAITTYFNPMVCSNYAAAYEPARAAGALTRNLLGLPYLYRYGADIDDLFVVSQYDFFKRAGRVAYAERLGEAIADGYDGWMEDFGEYTPLDSVSGAGIDGARAHNEYARRYHCSAWRAVREQRRPIVRFQRSGWTGAARCAQVVWGGDPTTGWDFDGLRSAVTQALSAGTSGIGIWGSDIGGFFALGPNSLSPELLTRWVQFGAFSGVMRTQRNGVAVPPKDRPQVTDPDQISNWRRYAKLRTQLYPYLLAAERDYRRGGMPLMRHLLLSFPGDRRAARTEDQFMLGDDLLVAPILEPGARERDVYLPRGGWIDFWKAVRYRERDGALRLRSGSARRGRRDVTVPAPLKRIPLFVRAGEVLPLLAAGVDTLARYGRQRRGLVRLADRRRRLELLAFPRGTSASRFDRDGKLRSVVSPGRWALRISSRRRLRVGLQAALPKGFGRPCSVELDARRVSFTHRAGVLRAKFPADRAASLVVRSDCG